MVQKVKDRIIGVFITIGAGVIVSIFSVGYANRQLDSKEQERKINAIERDKLSRKEYLEDQNKRDVDHQKIHDRDRSDILYIRTKTDDIYEYLLESK
jgi:hypothetical protein